MPRDSSCYRNQSPLRGVSYRNDSLDVGRLAELPCNGILTATIANQQYAEGEVDRHPNGYCQSTIARKMFGFVESRVRTREQSVTTALGRKFVPLSQLEIYSTPPPQ